MFYIVGLIFVILIATIIALGTHVVEVELRKISINVPSKFRYVHISDIHNKLSFVNGRVSNIINSRNPDFVVATGDYSNTQEGLPNVISELGDINCKVFMVLGNYEREEEKNIIKKREITLDLLKDEVLKYDNLKLLVNEDAKLNLNESRVSIYGFDNSTYGNEEYNPKDFNSESDYKIILAHSPNIINVVSEEQIGYNHILVGHTHGKQLNIPINKTAYDKFHIGLKRLNDHQFFSISRGLGTVRIPIRLKSKPSIDVYDIK
ncbi:MAG: metallophosphoesterase [Maledivibacter sp.]|jgi:predicted MPP superfamily phosphohydrolase|nr:metallophosphoesterase [Maledivibacter sp.]